MEEAFGRDMIRCGADRQTFSFDSVCEPHTTRCPHTVFTAACLLKFDPDTDVEQHPFTSDDCK